MTEKMTEKQKFINYVKLHFDIGLSREVNVSLNEFCRVEFGKFKLNIYHLICVTLYQYELILKPIAQKYDLKNDLTVIRDAITQCKNITYDDEIGIIGNKLLDYEYRIVWWFLPNKIRKHYFQQTLSDHFGKPQIKKTMKILSEEYHLF